MCSSRAILARAVRARTWGLSLAVAALLAAPAMGQEILRTYPGSVALAPGDIIRIAFWREAELGGDFPIDETGSVVLPVLGTWNVAGVPSDELRAQLADAYSGQLRNQDVQIMFLHRVSILGAVENPGLYHVDATMTVREAIALAGGVSDDGKKSELHVRRADSADYTMLDPRLSVGKAVYSGDEILIPQRSWFSRNSVPLITGALSATAIFLSRAWF